MIYLDNAATTQISKDVLREMMPYLTSEYGNPGGLYVSGRKARDAVERARFQVALMFDCSPENVIFTSGGSEGNNMIIRGLFNCGMRYGKAVASSSMEHDSIVNCIRDIHANHVELPHDDSGRITLDSLKGADLSDVALVSVMYANNETGIVNDIQDIGNYCAKNGILFHSDCVQAAGNYDIGANALGFDFATISSHKIHGPKGVGAIYASRPELLSPPIISGGSHQEFGLRGGTENVAGIVGFGKACEIATKNIALARQHYKKLREFLISELQETFGDTVVLNCESPEDSKVVNLWIKGVDAESLILAIGNHVCVSAGSACNSFESVPSRVLACLGFPESRCRESIRISFSQMTTKEDIENAVSLISWCVYSLRNAK